MEYKWYIDRNENFVKSWNLRIRETASEREREKESGRERMRGKTTNNEMALRWWKWSVSFFLIVFTKYECY